MLHDAAIRRLIDQIEDKLLDVGPTYAVTVALHALRNALPTLVEDLEDGDSDDDYVYTSDEILARQDDLIGTFVPADPPPPKTVPRPSHL